MKMEEPVVTGKEEEITNGCEEMEVEQVVTSKEGSGDQAEEGIRDEVESEKEVESNVEEISAEGEGKEQSEVSVEEEGKVVDEPVEEVITEESKSAEEGDRVEIVVETVQADSGEGVDTPEVEPAVVVEPVEEAEEISEAPKEPEEVKFIEIDDPSTNPETVEPAGEACPKSDCEEEDVDEISVVQVQETEACPENMEGDDTVRINETDSDDAEVDLVELLNKKDVFLYEIPMEDKSKSRKASEWNLNEPIWNGNLQLLSQGTKCVVKLEDEEQNLYGYAVVECYPSDDLRPVTDSTRYFIIKFTKDNSDCNEPDTEEIVGIGFADRKDSADFTWTIVEYFKGVEKEAANAAEVSAEVQEEETDNTLSADQPQVSKKRKINSDGSAEPLKKVMFQDQVPTSSSHIVIEEGDVEKYVKQGLKRPGIFPCHLCSASFDDMRHIKTHWHQVHDLRHPAHCVDCHRPFPTTEKMVEHRNEIHGYKCPKCQRAFKLDRLLESHFLTEHLEQLEYRCSLCPEKYEARAALKSHLENAHPSSLVRCPECPPEKLFTEAELVAHKGFHDKYMFCHLCDAGFSTKGQLRNHMEQDHVGAEPLKLL